LKITPANHASFAQVPVFQTHACPISNPGPVDGIFDHPGAHGIQHNIAHYFQHTL